MFIPAVKHLNTKHPVQLVIDVHHSHIILDFFKLAKENNIHLLCLPPHTTHLLQPLDVSVLGSVKAVWKELLKQHQIEIAGNMVTKEDCPALAAESITSTQLKSGFQKTAPSSFSKDVISSAQLMKLLSFAQSSSNTTDLPSETTSSGTTSAIISSATNSSPETLTPTLEISGVCTVDVSQNTLPCIHAPVWQQHCFTWLVRQMHRNILYKSRRNSEESVYH